MMALNQYMKNIGVGETMKQTELINKIELITSKLLEVADDLVALRESLRYESK